MLKKNYWSIDTVQDCYTGKKKKKGKKNNTFMKGAKGSQGVVN